MVIVKTHHYKVRKGDWAIVHLSEPHTNALIATIEIVLMSLGNTKYNLVIAKLEAYNRAMRDSHKDPEVLKNVLKSVYGSEYGHIINEIKIHLGEIVNQGGVPEFFKIMES